MGCTQMDDDLTHQAQPDELNSERHQQNSEQKSRPIGDSLSLYPSGSTESG